ncbi:MAG: ribonuclease HI family protein [Terriglobales bacterium]
MPFRQAPRKRKAATSESLFPVPGAPEHRLIAHIDGGARGNPGPAGYGVVIEDGGGRRVAELSRFLGVQTNNYAEYMGLLAALEYARQQGAKALEVISDSELMVRQMNGRYKVRSPMLLDLFQQAKAQVSKLEWFRIRHTLRAGNKDADALANRAMDEGMGRR